jgi:uncharacterized membrane protein
MGLIFGELLEKDADRAGRMAGWAGLGFLMLFVILRAIGGFGNLNKVLPGVMGFLNVTKYPPGLDFLTVTMGMNLLLVALWGRIGPSLQKNYHPLLVFGRVPLFFYLLHLWVYGLLGLFSTGGSTLVTMYGFWLLGLFVLYPLCYWYNGFKHRKPLTSLWQLF